MSYDGGPDMDAGGSDDVAAPAVVARQRPAGGLAYLADGAHVGETADPGGFHAEAIGDTVMDRPHDHVEVDGVLVEIDRVADL